MTQTVETTVREATSAVTQLLLERKSIVAFDPDVDLTDAELDALLTTAGWASSWRNSQPWAFVALRRGTTAFDAFVATATASNQKWLPNASVIVVAVENRIHELTSADDIDYALYDLGQAMGTLAIAAAHAGIDSHQFAGFDHAAVRTVLRVPDAWAPTVGIALGFAATSDHGDSGLHELIERDRTKQRARKSANEFAFEGAFGVPLSTEA